MLRALGGGRAAPPFQTLMKLWIVIAALVLSGCSEKKPLGYRFTGCQIQRTWIDEQGKERKDCDCQNSKQIGWDAKKRLAIVRCQ